MPVSVHTIAFKGWAGLSFILLMLASIFFVLGFSSHAWGKWEIASSSASNYIGLWEGCNCASYSNTTDWFKATQAFMVLGLVGLVVAVVLTTLYMCVHRISKNATLVALVASCFAATACMLIGIIIFGVELDSPYDPDWSFAMAIIGMCFTCAAGVISVIQMMKSDVPCCKG